MTRKNLKICPCLRPSVVVQPLTTFRKVLALQASRTRRTLALLTSPATQPHLTSSFLGHTEHSDTFLIPSLASLWFWNARPLRHSHPRLLPRRQKLPEDPCREQLGKTRHEHLYSADHIFICASVPSPGCEFLKGGTVSYP